MDNGPEFISRSLRAWAIEEDLVLIPLGQPWGNGFIESLNGRPRDVCLGVNELVSLNHAKRPSGYGKRITT